MNKDYICDTFYRYNEMIEELMTASRFSTEVLVKLKKVLNEFPNRNAFFLNNTYYTYGQFGDLISKIRTRLRSIQAEIKTFGLVVHDDLETYASIFALWMEGMAYVPLHPKQPLERNMDIVSQALLKYVLDSDENTLYKSSIVVKTKECRALVGTTDIVEVSDENLAYILFTSGSTGKPKGVQITRRNLEAFTEAFFRIGFILNENDRCLQCFDLTFDVSIQSFLAPLISGACVYTVPHDQIKYSYVYGLLEDHELTFGVFTPSMVRYLKPYFDEIYLEKLRYCVLTAEASPVDLVTEWTKCLPNAQIFNFYGPTEATIYCTYYEVKKESKIKEINGMLCIGKPFYGVKTLILDEQLQSVEKRTKGELYLSGKQLTKGYWANPERNEDSFVDLSFDGITERFYKTGDLCIEDQDGDLLLCGRIDYQVKIQGHRVELGEIEFHAREITEGNNAIAFAYVGNKGNQEIGLCLETETFDSDLILNTLRYKLPPYMIPAKVINLNEFPLNNSGKVDRKKIKTLLS